ncbi:MAG: hypothetical protein HFACDABA_01682 [Anaerolineales bacterium]|nr:hypothetical protein [Anaerolineales bacterium]
MQLKYSRWVFQPSDERLPEENERWWSECYLPHAVQNILENRERWCILLGKPQSGKSTALEALRRNMEGKALVVQDDVLFQTKDEKTETNILHRILVPASLILRQDLSKTPSKFSLLSSTQIEFMRWLVEKFHGHRAFMRWLDGLPQEFAQTLQEIPYEDIYPSYTSDVGGQIEELKNLCAKLGYSQVVVVLDSPPFLTAAQEQDLDHDLSWLEPMQHAGLKVVMALPASYTQQRVKELSRGRADIFEMDAVSTLDGEILARHLALATEGTLRKVEQLGSPKLISKLKDFVQEELGVSTIGTWLKIVKIILDEASAESTLPLTIEALPKIKFSFYTLFSPLRLGPQNETLGVWRGHKWIPLDRAVYDFLAVLIHHKGKHIDHEAARTTKGNLHTLARRLRVAIEPDPTQSIYLKNNKGEGYWLEKSLC